RAALLRWLSRVSSPPEDGPRTESCLPFASCPCVESTTVQTANLTTPLWTPLRTHRNRQLAVSPTAPLSLCRGEQGAPLGRSSGLAPQLHIGGAEPCTWTAWYRRWFELF